VQVESPSQAELAPSALAAGRVWPLASANGVPVMERCQPAPEAVASLMS
jgi:hypothetical protein